MPVSSAWMRPRTSRCFFSATTGNCPAFSALRQDRNQTVGTIERTATRMNTESLVKKAWLER
jgi:hypothetical protein